MKFSKEDFGKGKERRKGTVNELIRIKCLLKWKRKRGRARKALIRRKSLGEITFQVSHFNLMSFLSSSQIKTRKKKERRKEG